MHMESVESVVIGGGVIGLAVARALALDGREVLLLEGERTFGTQISSRNSGVIHAGLYYPTGSLKARTCVEGNRSLYRYCAERHVAHRRCGKIVVAVTADQVPKLRQIQEQAASNCVDDLVWLSASEVAGRAPGITGVAGLWSPSTGIIDAHGLMLAYLGDFEAAGGLAVFEAPVVGGTVGTDGLTLEVGGRDPMRLAAGTVVNAAGLGAVDLARNLTGMPERYVPQQYFAKGNYFALEGRAPFETLIYPIPVEGGLGIHMTLDLDGRARFGPDVEWVAAPDYTVNPGRADKFYEAIRSYWPDLPDGSLLPDYAGVRPKIVGPGQPPADFAVSGPEVHGIPGLANLYGIESPGLTASLALAEEVLKRLAE